MKEKLLNILNKSFSFKLGKRTFSVNGKILAIIILALIVAVSAIIIFASPAKKTSSGEIITATVTRGDVQTIIEGTGTISAISQYDITSLAKGDVIADYFEEGDTVEKGALLYQIDTASAESSIEKAQMNYDRALETAENQTVKATATGTITELNIEAADEINSGTKVCTIIDYDNLILTLPFNSVDAQYIYAGDTAEISLENTYTTVWGTVNSVSTGSIINSYGVKTSQVEILVKNPGGITEGAKATAIIKDYACNDAGQFKYKSNVVVTAKGSGTVTALNYKTGDYISKGAVICTLSSTSSGNSLKEAKLNLDEAYENLEDYNITAPISGKIIQKTIKSGEKLDNNSSATMAIIADLSELVFEMYIDELDISKIEVNQNVNITADAFENQRFTGKVSKVSIVGTSSNGVTTYPVEVTLDNPEETKLIPGMNVSASIVVDEVTDVLRVPVSAVRRGNFVIVKANSDTNPDTVNEMPDKKEDIASKRNETIKKSLDVPNGYTVVQVETGLSDGTFIEIKSGLSEGDIVLLPDTTESVPNGIQRMQQMGGMPGGMMPGGMQGGMSGGRMPGGMSR